MTSSQTAEGSRRVGLRAISLFAGLILVACSSDEPAPASVIPPATAGVGGPAAACGVGQGACAGVCTNLQVDPHNCGVCGKSCGTGSCAAAQCLCPSNLTSCTTGCVDTLNDPLNCGTCAHACGPTERCQQGQCLPPTAICTPACVGGQICSNNVCKCPETTTFCGGACVNTLTTPAHCGMCNAACAPGSLCEAGKCTCPTGQMLCGTQCVDVQQSTQNCGMCGKACNEGESCMAGTCRAPAGADGCTGTPSDLAISEVAAFQTIKIPLSKGVTPIDPAMHTTLVQGRPTLFRVYVTPGTGFAAREFSARVTVKNGAGSDQYFAKQMISKASSDADTASTFQISVPKEKIAADTKYSVELVDCGKGPAATGTAAATRMPAMGDLALSAKDIGTLKITVIPLLTNSMMPDTSDKTLEIYKNYFLAMYPIDKIEITVGKSMNIAYPVNWNTVIEQLRAQRTADKPAPEVYYYGFLKPTATLADYCRRGCTAGVGYVGSLQQAQTRVALGLAYGDEMSASTMAHEVGHNHGRNHAPCAPGNQIQGVDSRFPYKGASIGVWGYDLRNKKFFDPAKVTDIMGYCDPKWISDYTYKGLIDRSAMINVQSLSILDPEIIQAYRVLLLDADGPRWSQPLLEPDAPFGTAEDADVLDIDDQPIERVTVYRTQIGDSEGSYTLLVPEPKQGWASIKVHDALPLSFAAPIAIPMPQ